MCVCVCVCVCSSVVAENVASRLLARGGDRACEYRSGLLSLLTEAPQKQSLSAMVWLIPTRVHAACSACWRPRQNRVSETLGPLVADTNRPAYLIRPIESARVPSCSTVCLGERERAVGGRGDRERLRQRENLGERETDRQTETQRLERDETESLGETERKTLGQH